MCTFADLCFLVYKYNVQFQKIPILPPTEGFLFCTPLLPGNSDLFSYIASKNLTF